MSASFDFAAVVEKGHALVQKLKEDDKARQIAIAAGLGILAVGGLTALALSSGGNNSNKQKSGKAKGKNGKLGEANVDGALVLNKYEEAMRESLISPESLGEDCGFASIGGLEEQIAAIEELVILPLSRPDLFAHSKVASTPSGVLLYGPPGTGKTMLAKAIAKEASASFLALNISTIENKWFGETPKLIDALFSLARKTAPTVIFIDECDGFLGTRVDNESQHTSTMKTKLMECWDGLKTAQTDNNNKAWVLVVAATNKPWALDPAVLRRMPRQIEVSLPDAKAREAILRVLLQGEKVSSDLDVPAVALASEGYSGSDLKEVVRAASMIPIREALRAERAAARAVASGAGGAGASSGSSSSSSSSASPRPISEEDFFAALEAVRPNGALAKEYQYKALCSGTNWGTKKPRGIVGGAGAAASSSSSSSSSFARSAMTPKGSSPPSSNNNNAGGSDENSGSISSNKPLDEPTKAILMFGPSARANSINLAAAIERDAATAAASKTSSGSNTAFPSPPAIHGM